jgi:hypothetical protein
MQKLPLGLQEFSSVREANLLYVDKTKSVVDVLSSGGKYFFLSRPRRFGKSLLVNTMKELYRGNKALFEGLWAETHWDWEKKHPVIQIDFSKIGVMELPLEKAIYQELNDLYQTYEIPFPEREGVGVLFKMLIISLQRKYQKKVVVLIDEYDKPILEFLDDLERVEVQKNVLKSFYSVLKGSDAYLEMVFITGVSKFAKVSIFSDLNNLTDLSTNKKFNELIGITQEELEKYFSEHLQHLAQELEMEENVLLKEVKKWYNGYSWTGKKTLYNPYSLLAFFFHEEFNNYWFETGTPTFLTKMLKKDFIYDLQDRSLDDFSLKTLSVENPELSSLLFQTGYLTITGYDKILRRYTLNYPNYEVHEAFTKWLLAEFGYFNPAQSTPIFGKLYDALTTQDFELFRDVFNSLFAKIPQDYFVENREKFYHAIIFLAIDMFGFYIEIEKNAGRGRLDAVLKIPEGIFLLEFKLDKSAEEALAQIKDRAYYNAFKADGRAIFLLGINLNSQKKEIDEIAVEKV